MIKEITKENIKNYQEALKNIPHSEVVKRAVMNNGINKASEDTEVIAKNLNRNFSIDIDTGEVSNQKHSGRCWLFATLNTLRYEFTKKYNVKDFEFSQNYLSFWDRFEKANAFYNFIVQTANEPLDSRIVNTLLKTCDGDGGQWDNAPALINKYGLLPKYAMPETNVSNDTTNFNQVLNFKLRKDALTLRNLINKGAKEEEVSSTIEKMLNEVYRICVYSFGEPPEKFDFEYRDEDKKYHQDLNLTPKEFAKKYISRNLDDYVVVINSPDKEYNKIYSLPMENNIIGGRDVLFLNLELDTFKKLLIDQLKEEEPTWFACDVLKQMCRDDGLLGADLFKYEDLFDIDLNLSKADRLSCTEATVSHAMTMVGVDLVDEKPTRWKVENSWGEKVGKKGYFVMDDKWFNEHVYHVVINKKFLTKEQLEVLNTKPIELTLWDSMA
ncbi:C1 family peptidase [Eubacterium multiforme]|uniref:Aminopeptidase n=1 Tax=Eubacterium multiforme TaxID=83339 RepID=A0ABT9USV0_9FIRM|nr:C1 family peptidase [Eubacterium multiforme]MDQ0149387.1 bleomycin hydrolase [Eubacterium multiforme]